MTNRLNPETPMSKDNLIERLWNPERATVPYQSLGDICREAADALIRKQALIEEQDKIIEDLGEQANRWRNEWGEAKALIEEMVKGLKRQRDYGCLLCAGDCGSANPPVAFCPMQDISALITKATNT